jgi:hypothetical protein
LLTDHFASRAGTLVQIKPSAADVKLLIKMAVGAATAALLGYRCDSSKRHEGFCTRAEQRTR